MNSDQLSKICPSCKDPESWAMALTAASEEFEINNERRMSAWIAQCAHESSEFNVLVENLSYSARGLLTTFDHYFEDREQAEQYAHQPERIADLVYANRMGNGDEESGDGWKFRGRGPIQATGRDLYEMLRDDLAIDCVSEPDLLISPAFGSRAAAHFWCHHGLNEKADAMRFDLITKGVNGMFRWNRQGDLERAGYYEVACDVFGVTDGSAA